MQAWIGNLAAYNNGKLIGEWVNLTDDADDMGAEITRICGTVEHYIADYSDLPRALTSKLGEYASGQDMADAVTVMRAMRDACPDAVEIGDMLDAMIDTIGYGKSLADLADEAEEWVSDNFLGLFDTLTAYGEDYCDESGILDSIPEQFRSYFDCEAYARDLELGGEIFTRRVSGGLLIFRNS